MKHVFDGPNETSPSSSPEPGPSTRLSGFYRMDIDSRRSNASRALKLDAFCWHELENGGLDTAHADKTIENVVGTYALPFALAVNLRINDRDYVAPMVIEEPSVVAAVSNAARIVRECGGFRAEADASIMVAQVFLDDVRDTRLAAQRVSASAEMLLRRANAAVPGLVTRGGGARSISTRDLGEGNFVVEVAVDCLDAMGANLVNSVAESLGDPLSELLTGRVGMRILTNLADQRRVRCTALVSPRALAFDEFTGEEVRDGIVRASRIAELDVYRAATHNKGVMNGIDAVVVATGNDWRAVNAGAHAWAARTGRYSPIARWTQTSNGDLLGALELPLALGIVGGPVRHHRGAQLALKVARAQSSAELAMLAATVGLAANFAALRALATEGIQRGHMLLHARSVASAAGAEGDEVAHVATAIHARSDVSLDAALRILTDLRAQAAK